LGGVAHAVDGDVVIGGIAAQVDCVAIAAAALAGAEGDARDGGEGVAQGQQILAAQHLVGDDGDGLRRVEQGRGRARRFEPGLLALPLDEHVIAGIVALFGVALPGAAGVDAVARQVPGQSRRGEETDRPEREEQGRTRRGAPGGNLLGH